MRTSRRRGIGGLLRVRLLYQLPTPQRPNPNKIPNSQRPKGAGKKLGVGTWELGVYWELVVGTWDFVKRRSHTRSWLTLNPVTLPALSRWNLTKPRPRNPSA